MLVSKAEGQSSVWYLQWRCYCDEDVAASQEAWRCSYLCPTRNCVDVLEVSPGSWGVMLSHGVNYSSWMNCSGHGVRLVKTLVPASVGRWLRQKQRLAFAFTLRIR